MSPAEGSTNSGGITALVWGIFATTMGWLLVTDHHGITRWFIRNQGPSRPRLRRSRARAPLTQQRRQRGAMIQARLIGGVFAIVGTVALITGIVAIAHGHAGSLFTRVPDNSWPIRIISAVIPAGWLARLWLPGRGWFTKVWRIGSTVRRGLAILASAALVAVGAAWWAGMDSLWLALLLVASLTTLAALAPLFAAPAEPDTTEQ